MFQKHVFNVTFLKHFMFSMSRFWNISCFHCHVSETYFQCYVSETFYVFKTFHSFNVTFLKHFTFWMLHFWNILRFERHFSETFHVLNVTFLKQFIFWMSDFWNVSCFECHIFKTMFGYLTPVCCVWSQFQIRLLFKWKGDQWRHFLRSPWL